MRAGFDPLRFLALSGEDYSLAVAILNEANRLEQEAWQRRTDYLSARTAGMTASHILRGLRRMLRG